MTRNTILVDIDHTLSNAFPRDVMIGGEGGWDAYHAASIDDEPLHDVRELVNALFETGHRIVAFTARPGKWRQLTMEWLVRNGVRITDLLMRPDEDHRPSAPMKVALALEFFGSEQSIRDEVAMLIEDHEEVVTAFKGIGITVMQCHGRAK